MSTTAPSGDGWAFLPGTFEVRGGCPKHAQDTVGVQFPPGFKDGAE